MNRTLFSIAALFGALMPLVFDSALKGAVLLATAALVTLALWRASAAARHLVWLVAIVALLIVPVLSLALPQWRVLPQWAGGTVPERTENRPYTPNKPYTANNEPIAIAEEPAPEENPAPAAAAPRAVSLPAAAPLPTAHPQLPTPAPTWREYLPLAWCIGFAALAVRLLAAHLLLRRASRQCPALTAPPDEKIAAAFADACARLGIRQRVTLLLDKKRTIPVVWGVFRPRLMLPIEAREWSDEQLCSVLLHELGHIKRRDTLVQWLTQIACALHWWNPLVWLAAWRLHAERERACDDLVLASGVRPSAYAEHLLDVATRLSPARWTSACGLAMARKSSLEGRLMAVLSEKLNRNGVTRALAIAALVLGAAIALPVAMLRAAEEKWTAPSGAHIGGNDFSAFCIRDGNDTAFVIAYRGDFNSSTTSSSNAKARTWTDAGTITTVKSGIQIDFRREHTAPAKLTIAQKEYDLTKGRVFYLTAEGIIRQLDIPKRPIRDRKGADQLAKLVAGSGLSTGKGVRTQGGMRVYFGPSRLPEKEAGTFTVSPSGQEKAEFVLIALGKFRTADNSEQFPDTGKIRIAGEMIAPDGRIFAFSREPDSGHITVNGTPHILAEGRVLVFGPGERVRQLPVFPEAIPVERAPMPKFDTLKKLIREIPALSQPAAEAPKSADAKNRDEQYVKSGIPLVELKEDVSWNGTQNGLSLGYRIIGDEWRILGKQVTVELWVRNIGNEGVKFQLNTRPDIGLRMKLKNAKGEEKMATIVPNDRPLFGEHRLLPPGHALKVKEFPISLFRPINDVSSVRDHFFPIEPGAYEFHCELELPGFSATGEGGKQLTPAAGEWTGKLTTPSVTVHVVAPDAPKSVLPKNQYARAHFAHLQKYARENGDIPGGLVALLDRSLANKDPKLDALGKRLDATRDWTAKETAEFLDAAAATGDWTGDDGRLLALENYDIGQHGSPLPADLAALPWGKADDGVHPAAEATGLRAAFTLEPAAASYAQGTQIPVTVHFHNSGTAPLVFPVGFRSMDMAEAQDEQGRKLIAVWTFPNGDNAQMKDGPWKPKYSVRLEPGHWISVSGARLTIAAGRHSDTPDSHGIAMIAPTDSTVKLKWIPMIATWNEGYNKKPFTWKDRVAKRIEIVSPMPKSRADREKLLKRVTLDLTGEEPTNAEVAAFIADDAPDALAKLTARFQALPPLARFGGWLKTGEQKFKVTLGATDYRGTVMSANGPGLYELAESVVLQHYGPHANLEFIAPEPVPQSHTIELKDKQSLMAPHGIVWKHGSGIVFVAQKERVRKYDYSVPGKLTKTDLPAGIASIPEELRVELVKAFPAIETAAATKASKGAEQRRKMDWSKVPPMSFFEGKYDPELLTRLVAKPDKDGQEVWQLSEQILRAAVEKDPQFRHLLKDEKLKVQDTESRILTMSLAAYDYSVFASKDALKVILDQLGSTHPEAYLAAFPLGFVDEWEQSIPAMQKCFARADGAKGEESGRFWIHREWLFPESFAVYLKKQLVADRLDPESLRGVWQGSKDGVSVTLRFGENQGWEVRQGEKVWKSELSTVPTGGAPLLDLVGPDSDGLLRKLVEAHMAHESEKTVHRGTLRSVKDGTMTLYIRGDFGHKLPTGYPGVNNLVLAKETEKPKGADAGQRRTLDWSKFPYYEAPAIPFANPFVPADALRLAAEPNKSKEDVNRLVDMIHQATAEKTMELRPLLADEKLKASGDKDGRIGFALAAYDYSVNGNKAGLQRLLDAMALDDKRKEETAAWSLVYVDEWELTQKGFDEHFGRFANAEEHDLFWNIRKFLYPEQHAEFQKKKQAAAKLTPDTLLGTWRGKLNGENLMLSFHRPPAEKTVQLDIYEGDATIGLLARFTIQKDGASALVVLDHADSASYGMLRRDDEGKLKLELHNPQKGQKEVVLTRDPKRAATAPRQKEARELFEVWKQEASEGRADWTIPYFLIDQLAAEVRAFVHANPNLDSASKLSKLLPRFVTFVTDPWSQAEAIQLLDDVTYYSTKPIEAYLARERAMEQLVGNWEGTVNGRAAALRIWKGVQGSASIGMEMRYPADAQVDNIGYTVALDGVGMELRVDQIQGKPTPFGRLDRVTENTLRLTLNGKDEGVILTRKVEPLPKEPNEHAARELFEVWKATTNDDGTIPGTFIGQLATEVRAYVKANPNLDSGAKMPELLPRFDTRRAWTQAEAIALLDDVAYYSTKPITARVAKAKLPSGPMWRTMVEFQDIPVKIEKWSEPLRGLRMGMHIAGGEWRTGGKVRVELWLHNAGEKDVEFSASGPDRADGGLTASATDADGREHWAVAGNNRIIAIPMPCVLPAGHAAMVKGFDLPFTEGDASRVRRAPEFIGLQPGEYKLRCSWVDAAGLYEGKEWKGSLTAPEFPFTLAAAGEAGEAKPGAKAMEPQTLSEALNAALAQRGQVSPRIGWAELEPNSAKRMEREVTGRSSVVPPTVPPEPTASGYNIILQDGNRPSSGEPFPQIEKMSAADLDAKIALLRSDWEKNSERWVPAHPRMKAIATALDQLVSEKGRRLPAITRGKLVDEVGKPLGKRIIFIVAPDYKPGQTALQDGPTNEDGTFQFELPVGTPWQVLIPREGMLDGPRSREFTIEKADAKKNGEPEHELSLKLDGGKVDAELKPI